MMRKVGNICVVIGLVLVVAALIFAAVNRSEDRRALAAADKTMGQISRIIEEDREPEETRKESEEQGTVSLPDPYDTQMTEKKIDGIRYVGYLSIPALELELPVTSEWNYDNLKIAACRYYGSSKADDLIIAAHNYTCYFGPINSLEPGDEIVFTDMDGIATIYEVMATEVLDPTAVEDMISGEYSLTLFTCTYDTTGRITVRCDKKKAVMINQFS